MTDLPRKSPDEVHLIEALRSEAERIVPNDRLDQILERASTATVLERPLRPRRPRWQVPLAVATAAVCAVAGWAVLAGPRPSAQVVPGVTLSSTPAPSAAPQTPTPAPSAAPATGSTPPGQSPTGPASSPAAASVAVPTTAAPTAVPVYAVGREAGAQSDLVVYRTFHQVSQVTTDPVQRLSHAIAGALTLSLVLSAVEAGAEVASDGFSSGPAAVRFGEAEVSATEIVVPLSAPGAVSAGGRRSADLIIASWVRTAQAVVGKGNVPVRFETPSGALLLGHYDPARRWTQADLGAIPLAKIWIDGPTGTLGAGDPVTVRGLASVAGGALSWSLRQSSSTGGGDVQIRAGRASAAAAAPARGVFTIEVGALPPGAYEVFVTSTNPADGSVIAQQRSAFSVE